MPMTSATTNRIPQKSKVKQVIGGYQVAGRSLFCCLLEAPGLNIRGLCQAINSSISLTPCSPGARGFFYNRIGTRRVAIEC